jgi:hypothetical protein
VQRVVDLVVLERLTDEDHVARVVLDEQDFDDVRFSFMARPPRWLCRRGPAA